MSTQKATFAAGCFWGVEHRFRQMPGVLDAVSGYIGGHKDKPAYKEVCRGETGHAEAVEITFDPRVITYETLLTAFWAMHDPTQLNRQGPDIGTQYRSAVFYHDEAQKEAALRIKDSLKEKFPKPVVTEIVPAAPFWPAEDYHQRYIEKNGGVCHL